MVALSVLGFFFSPREKLVEQLKTSIPWITTGIIISEVVLTTGFLLMLYVATPAFIKSLTKNINGALSGLIKLKETISEFDWKHVANKCNKSKLFWFGFWLSIIGACGDGIVLIIGIGKSLPVLSWGLMILPFWDLGLTYLIRRAIYTGIRK